MKRYKVSFYYYTDCRWDWTGEAQDVLRAIVYAEMTLDGVGGHASWCSYGKGFKITVELVDE